MSTLTKTLPTGATEQEMLVLLMNLPDFQSVSVSGTDLTITFSQDISGGVEGIVDQRLADWCCVIRIYDYIENPLIYNMQEPPLNLNFRTGLAPGVEFQKTTTVMWQGDIQEQIFYAHLDLATQTYSIPVVRRTYEIEYHPSELRIYANEILEWYKRDGTLHETKKSLPQNYIGQRYWVWWKEKRNQIIEWLTHNVAMAMAANLMPLGWTMDQIVTEGHAFYDAHSNSIFAFVSGGGTGLSTAITVDTRTWLDMPWPWTPTMTIRDKFLEQINA